EESTGVRLATVSDTGLTYSDGAKYIVLGRKNAIYTSAGFNLDTNILKGRGFYVKTKGDCLFIVGHKGEGVLNGVYKFLNLALGYDYFGIDQYTIRDMEDKDLPFLSMDITEVPDIKFNVTLYGESVNNPVNTKKLGLVSNSETIMSFGGQGAGNCHNSFFVCRPEVYQEAHPLWYAPNCEQLCYLTGGNQTEYQALVNHVAEEMKKTVAASHLEAISFTHNDNTLWCNCSTCRAYIAAHNGSNSATQIKFINDVAAIVAPWYKENFPEKQLTILIFAYHGTVQSPNAKDSTGKYVAQSDMVLHENVAIWYAPYHQANFYVPFNNSKENTLAYDIIESWKPSTSKFYLWFYTCHFADYTIPVDSMTGMQSTFQYLVNECNVEYYMNQGQFTCNTSDWSWLKLYMQSKLGWDCYYSYEKILDDFFTGVYGPAADIMREYYDDYKFYFAYIYEKYDAAGSPEMQGNYSSPEVWNEGILKQWLAYFDRAFAAIEIVKYSDVNLYNMYKDNLLHEQVSPAINLVHFQPSSMNEVDLAAFKAEILANCARLGLYGSTGESGGALADILG
ncbi:MAG: DUF4838 domain-containing protein, partial [Clostridia bacterium]|nr:DUF4838 domain-containing protein [Clostridia bacterium]